MKPSSEFVVVGGGIVGASIAYGLLRSGKKTILLDGNRSDPRASVANFGLVWVQGKGPGVPAYQTLTRVASDLWPEFAAELTDHAGPETEGAQISLNYEREGGLTFCLGEEEYKQRASDLQRLHNHSLGLSQDCEMISRSDIEKLLPGFELGPGVVGGSFCWRDGCVNPLKLYTFLLRAIRRLGGVVHRDATVHALRRTNAGWDIKAKSETYHAEQLVLAAGLGTSDLATQAGLNVPVRPQRGQILVGERSPKVMRLPASMLRQSEEGTFLIGASKEDVGLDLQQTPSVAKTLAQRAIAVHPPLRNAKVVRQWAGLRIVTPDGAPIYEFGDGVSAAACHSGITLAPIHALNFVDQVLKGLPRADLAAFNGARFMETLA